MHLLTRYLLLQFARYFITINCALVAVYLLIDFFEKYDNFVDSGNTLGLAIKFFLFNIPFIVDQLGPILILLSGIITLGILNHSNELLALKAAGIPFGRIIRPVLIGAVILTTLFIGAAQILLPKTLSIANEIWNVQVRGKVSLGIYRNGRYYFKGEEGFYSFLWPNSKKMIFPNFSYSKWDENHNVNKVLVARFADWVPPYWVFKHGQIQIKNKDGSYRTELFTYTRFKLPENPEDFLIPEYDPAEKSLTSLYFNIGNQEIEQDRTQARADFYSRLSYLLLGLPLLVLGIPILMLSYRKWGKDLSIAIPVSCGMAFVAWGAWGALQSLAKAGYFPVIPAALLVHLVFAGAGIILIMRLYD